MVPNELFVNNMLHVLSLLMQTTHVIEITIYERAISILAEVLLGIDEIGKTVHIYIVSISCHSTNEQRPPLMPTKSSDFGNSVIHADDLSFRHS